MANGQQSGNPKGEDLVLHRASWLVPVTRPAIEDGALLVSRDTILDVGPYARVRAESPAGTLEVDHGTAAILPGLVNGHTHLELSALKGRIPLPKQGFPAWLNQMLQTRAALTESDLDSGFLKGLNELRTFGTALCGDITNGAFLETGSKSPVPARQVFLEVIGFNEGSLAQVLDGGETTAFAETAKRSPASLGAHSCYSTSAAVIGEAKAWCRREGRVFSIHVAEHIEEIEFLRGGVGYCRALLEALGKWAPCWAPPRTTPAAYLNAMGIMDEQTLLVHLVHMTESDWEVVHRSGASVCFCPRSNENLGVGKPDIPEAISRGIPCCLGTDSLASNMDLNLFGEAAWVLDNCPSISPWQVLTMATVGGASALGRDGEYGTIEPGKRPAFLVVPVPHALSLADLAEAIIHQGNKGAVQWANHPATD